jgi:hypothetical protein
MIDRAVTVPGGAGVGVHRIPDDESAAFLVVDPWSGLGSASRFPTSPKAS